MHQWWWIDKEVCKCEHRYSSSHPWDHGEHPARYLLVSKVKSSRSDGDTTPVDLWADQSRAKWLACEFILLFPKNLSRHWRKEEPNQNPPKIFLHSWWLCFFFLLPASAFFVSRLFVLSGLHALHSIQKKKSQKSTFCSKSRKKWHLWWRNVATSKNGPNGSQTKKLFFPKIEWWVHLVR